MTAVTAAGRIRAEKIIVATHFPFLNKHGQYFMKLYQHRSYVCALENAPLPDGMFVDEDEKGDVLPPQRRFFCCSAAAATARASGAARSGNWRRSPRGITRSPAAFTAGPRRIASSLDGVPRRMLFPPHAGFVRCGRVQQMGMTSSMVAAELLRDLITGRENPLAVVLSPSRTMLRPQLAVNLFEATVGLLTPTARRCPHLGCALHWNPQERSWDCACHGSRFPRTAPVWTTPPSTD